MSVEYCATDKPSSAQDLPGSKARYAKTFSALQRHARKIRGLDFIRPNILATPLYGLLLPSQRRGIVHIDGVGRLFLDPSSHLGRTILADGSYEPETVALLREHVKTGDVAFDIGANEGIMSACMAGLVGAGGCVVAVEPQSRLLDILDINLALNALGKYYIIHGAISDRDGEQVSISLNPESNTGGSSIVNRYKWSSKNETVWTYTIQHIADHCRISHIDFLKIDVEGYEPEVVKAMLPFLAQGRIGKILLDYHGAILQARGVRLEDVHQSILARGYNPLHGSPTGGYVLYSRA
jgi:FkbM family methyltransferase